MHRFRPVTGPRRTAHVDNNALRCPCSIDPHISDNPDRNCPPSHSYHNPCTSCPISCVCLGSSASYPMINFLPFTPILQSSKLSISCRSFAVSCVFCAEKCSSLVPKRPHHGLPSCSPGFLGTLGSPRRTTAAISSLIDGRSNSKLRLGISRPPGVLGLATLTRPP
jgi:hypothetical protein